MLNEEQANDKSNETLHVIIQLSYSDAPMKLATRVLVETEIENGTWYANDATVETMDWAPNGAEPRCDAKTVKISNPKNSVSTMRIPGKAKLNIFLQFLNTLLGLMKPFQHFIGLIS